MLTLRVNKKNCIAARWKCHCFIIDRFYLFYLFFDGVCDFNFQISDKIQFYQKTNDSAIQMSRNVTNRLIGNYGHYRIGFGQMVDRLNIQNCTLQWNQRAASICLPICREYSIRNSSFDSTPSSTASSSMVPKINALLNETKKLAPASKVVIDSGKSLFRRQWDAFFNWYDEVSHTNEVRNAHRQVEEIQEKLNQAQNLRREVSKELNNIRYELQMCFADQVNCQKGDPRYLELVRREIEVNFIERKKNST